MPWSRCESLGDDGRHGSVAQRYSLSIAASQRLNGASCHQLERAHPGSELIWGQRRRLRINRGTVGYEQTWSGSHGIVHRAMIVAISITCVDTAYSCPRRASTVDLTTNRPGPASL